MFLYSVPDEYLIVYICYKCLSTTYRRDVKLLIMANTYTQSYFHLVFAVKNREALIQKRWKDDLEMYITGIMQNHKHKLLAIGCMPDHIHIFIGYNLNHLIPELVEEIKTSSNAWIKENKLSKYKFECQKG